MAAPRRPPRRELLVAIASSAAVAFVLFLGGIASDLVSNDLQEIIWPYRMYVWLVCGLALVTAVLTTVRASMEARNSPSSPVLSLEWSAAESAWPEPEVILIGSSEYGSSLVLTNTGPGSEKINRIVVKAAVMEQIQRPGGRLVSVTQEVFRFEAHEPDELNLAYVRDGSTWAVNQPLSFQEGQKISLPGLKLTWDESDLAVRGKIGSFIGAANLVLTMDVSVYTEQQTFHKECTAALRLLLSAESGDDGGVDELVSKLSPPKGTTLERLGAAYQSLRTTDASARAEINDSLNDLMEVERRRAIATELEQADDAIRADPANLDLLVDKGRLLVAEGIHGEALELFELAASRGAQSADLDVQRTITLLSLQRNDDAVTLAQAAVQRYPQDSRVVLTLADALHEKGNSIDAVDVYDRALALGAGALQVHLGRARALISIERFDEALNAYDRAIAIADNDPTVHVGRALSLAQLDRGADAVTSLHRAIDLGYQDIDVVAVFEPLLGKAHKADLAGLLKRFGASPS